MWALDAAIKNGNYFLFFPTKDKSDAIHIGVAISKSPIGPFKAESKPIPGSYSIDPAVFVNDDGKTYIYFGGIWGRQLQRWGDGKYDTLVSKTDLMQNNNPALNCRVVRLSSNMKDFRGLVRNALIIDSAGQPLLGEMTTEGFSKVHGCINLMANITLVIQPATRTALPMPSEIHHMDHSLILAILCSRYKAGQPITLL